MDPFKILQHPDIAAYGRICGYVIGQMGKYGKSMRFANLEALERHFSTKVAFEDSRSMKDMEA